MRRLEHCFAYVIALRCVMLLHIKMNNSADTFFIMENFDEKSLDVFLDIETNRQLASALDISYKNLIYNLYKLPNESKYEIFEIRKRNGGMRQICAPISGIKHIQKKLSIILNYLYKPKYCAHGYVIDKSIKTNAQVHVKKRIVVNVDLKDFFPSINFGRVRGLFKSYPFNFNDDVSTVLAQICCYDGCLPQGAPSSPMLSNYICRRLDNQMLDLSHKCKVDYTRYADDLTFSTNLKELPKEIGLIKDNMLLLSDKLINIIESNGFNVNKEKVRYTLKNNRQEITGLIVNTHINVSRKYIRHVRAMLHAWEKYGLEDAAKEHFEKYNYKNKTVDNDALFFVRELSGKIGYIKEKNSSVYRNLYKRIKALDARVSLPIPKDVIDPNTPVVFCEGKTDSIHLTTALNYFKHKGEFVDLNIIFFKYEENQFINNSVLYKMCETRYVRKKSERVEIYLFDGDDAHYSKQKICQSPNLYKYLNKRVYSVMLPIPLCRNFEEICIEHYYSDDEIKIMDKRGRRLYLSTEFDPQTGFHKQENLTFSNRSYLKAPYPRIIDGNYKVHKENGDNVALTKKHFAENIAKGEGDFKNISFENFKIIFELLSEILEVSKKHS